MILRLAVPVEHRLVTDGQTDGKHMTTNTRASYSAARVKKLKTLAHRGPTVPK